MSLYADYLRERVSKEVIEDHRGFVVYYYVPDGCYVEDIYVAPEHRRSGVAQELLERVVTLAKQKGCNKLYGTVCPSAKNSHYSLTCSIAYGFILERCIDNLIIFSKRI
jgi:GNAT superfamily N-acetyltransferase